MISLTGLRQGMWTFRTPFPSDMPPEDGESLAGIGGGEAEVI
jgi:hypothetical protein